MKNIYTTNKNGSKSIGLLKLLPILFVLVSFNGNSQCSTTGTPGISNGCIYNDQIDTFTLNAIPSPVSPGCSPNSYLFSSVPNWSMLIGNTYTWAATTGGGVYAEAFGLWIDLNQDGVYSTNEMLGNTPYAIAHSGTFTIPFSATGGVTRMRLRDNYYTNWTNSSTDPCSTVTYGETEDYLVTLIPPTPCSGTPASNSVVANPSTAVCPGSSGLMSLANVYTVGGLTYQWQSSTTSSVGPWANVANGGASSLSGTTAVFNTPTLSSVIFYQCVVTCTNSSLTANALASMVNIAATTTNNVPYFEGFEGIQSNDKLPNCSWSSTNPTVVAKTWTSAQSQNRIPRTGNKFAEFVNSPGGTNAFYTNGIRFEAGVTYSATVWYTTDYYGYPYWSDLSLVTGTAQAAVAMTQTIVSSNGSAIAPTYKPMTNTFVVANSGLYYVGIRASSTGASNSYHLSWDDLSIIVPCTLNTVSVSVNSLTNTICQGNSMTLTASGANTYLWNTGATTSSIVVAPNSNITYAVVGTNSLSNCDGNASQNIIVNPSPVVSIFADKSSVCKGAPVTLFAYGANTYMWSTTSNSSQIVATPSTATSYTVIGTNNFGCSNSAVQTVNVLNLPNVTGAGTSQNMCVGETVTLQASGAVTYVWSSNSLYVQNAVAIVSPNATTTYTLTGTDANGCSSSVTVPMTVNACLGVNSVDANSSNIKIFPNPNKGEFTVELNNTDSKTIQVVDVNGKLISSTKTSNSKVELNINSYSNGMYYVKVISGNKVDVIKIVKD